MKARAAAVLLTVSLLPGTAFAGWGAIAYDSGSGAVGEAHGYPDRGAAQNAAIGYCGRGGCAVINWEQNSCVAFAANASGHWGEAHGYANRSAAVAAAMRTCGAGCRLRSWACN